MLTTSLSYMITAGMSVIDGIKILMANPDSRINRHGLETMKDGIEEGWNLSTVFKNNEAVFGSGYWRQIDAAERTGKVPACLLRIAAQLKSSGDIASKIRGAMMYPMFIMLVAFVAAYYLFTTTIPEMGEMMMEFGAELPAITVAMMAVCDVLVNHGVLIIIGLVIVVCVFIYLLKGPLRLTYHKTITRIPLAAGISIDSNFARVYMLINDMIENGAHAVEALRVAASASANDYIMQDLLRCATTMEREGYSLAQALGDSVTMPSDDRLMLHVGDETGHAMDVLRDMTERRQMAANESVAHLLEMMTPIIMVAVCAVVGVIVVAVYMPMLTVASSMA